MKFRSPWSRSSQLSSSKCSGSDAESVGSSLTSSDPESMSKLVARPGSLRPRADQSGAKRVAVKTPLHTPPSPMHALRARANAQADYVFTHRTGLRANNIETAQMLSVHRQAVDRAANTVAQVVDELPPSAVNQTYVDEHLGAELLLKARQLSLRAEDHLLQAASITALHQTRCVLHNHIALHRMPDVWYFSQGSKLGSMKKTQNAGDGHEWGAISTTYGSQVVQHRGDEVQILTTPAHESEHVGQFACGRKPQDGEYVQAIPPDEALLNSWVGHPQRGSLEVKASLPLWDHKQILGDRDHPLWRLIYRSSPIELVAQRAQSPVDEALERNRNPELTHVLPMAALGQVAQWVHEALSLLDTLPCASGHVYQAKLEQSWADARPNTVFNLQTQGEAVAQQGRIHAEMGRLHHAAVSMAWSEARAAQLARHIARWGQSEESQQPVDKLQRQAPSRQRSHALQRGLACRAVATCGARA
jgi:hypothetical protein